jgi:hypothetical protein
MQMVALTKITEQYRVSEDMKKKALDIYNGGACISYSEREIPDISAFEKNFKLVMVDQDAFMRALSKARRLEEAKNNTLSCKLKRFIFR